MISFRKVLVQLLLIILVTNKSLYSTEKTHLEQINIECK